MNATNAFRSAIERAGLHPPAAIVPDGKLHRFASNGDPGDDAGWYVLFNDGLAAGSFGCWRTGMKQNWCAKADRQMTAQERAEHRRRIEAAQEQREADEQRRHAEAADRAHAIWVHAHPADASHPYLLKKRIQPHDLRVDDDNRLIVPVMKSNTLISLEFISPEGDKKFLPGGEVKGGSFTIGDVTKAGTILLGEGVATVASVFEATSCPSVIAFSANNLVTVAQDLRRQFPTATIILAGDHDESGTGQAKAKEAAALVDGVVVIPDQVDTDWNDVALTQGLQVVRRTIDDALAQRAAVERETELARLAALSPAEYGRERQAASERLQIPLTFLDQEREQRHRTEKQIEVGQGTAIAFPDVPASPDPVDGTELIDHLMKIFERYAVFQAHGALTLALWTIFTYVFDEFEIAPRLILESPEKRCGKTTVLSLLFRLVWRALLSSNVSRAVIFRIIAAYRPTLLIDEMDSFVEANEELRGILNSGHTRDGAVVIRTVGDDHEPRAFSTWAPMAFACIGRLPGTLEDRAIRLPMRRKTASEPVTSLRQIGPAAETLRTELQHLTRQTVRWVNDHRSQLHHVRLSIPDNLNDRAKDNWAPLLTIAEVLGEPWSTHAVQAAVALSGDGAVESESCRVQLLADIRGLFDGTTADRLSSEDLCFQLAQLEERPWSEWRKGKPITTNQLAALLRPFEVHSRTIRLSDGGMRKGYLVDDFADAFGRYLPLPTDPLLSKRHNVTTSSQSGDEPLFQGVTKGACDVSENGLNPAPDAACDAVTDENPESGEEEVVFEEDHAAGSR